MNTDSPAAENNVEQVTNVHKSKTKKCHDRRSFVASIMDAIHNAETPSSHVSASESCTSSQDDKAKQNAEVEHQEEEIYVKATPASQSVASVRIDSLEGSAFERVIPQSTSSTSSVSCIGETSRISIFEQSLAESEQTSSMKDSSTMKPLFEQVDEIKSVVYNITANLKALGDTVHRRVTSLQSCM